MLKKSKPNEKFLDLNVPVFINKNNGQWSVSIPKRKLKKFKNNNKKGGDVPKVLPIRLFCWWK
jgi:hypothetical protein